MPKELIKSFHVEIQRSGGAWKTLHHSAENARRLVLLPVGAEICALRFTGEKSWGGSPIRMFAFGAYDRPLPPSIDPPTGKSWVDVVAALSTEDLALPDHGLEDELGGTGRVGA